MNIYVNILYNLLINNEEISYILQNCVMNLTLSERVIPLNDSVDYFISTQQSK